MRAEVGALAGVGGAMVWALAGVTHRTRQKAPTAAEEAKTLRRASGDDTLNLLILLRGKMNLTTCVKVDLISAKSTFFISQIFSDNGLF
jgi:hypothetical protein